MNPSWAATGFDGRSAAGDIVLLRIDGDTLVIMSRSSLERVPVREVAVAEAFAHAPRMLGLPGGRTLEVTDPERTLPAALAVAGKRPSWVVRMQERVACSRRRARTPDRSGPLGVCRGTADRRAARSPTPCHPDSTAAWARTCSRCSTPERSNPRRSPPSDVHESPRSFARPQLSRRPASTCGWNSARARSTRSRCRAASSSCSTSSWSLPATMSACSVSSAHELGHVVHRHSMRQLFQALGVGAIAGVVWGDFSTIAANVPLVLGVMRYGRAFEHEADDFAIGVPAREQPLAAAAVRVLRSRPGS